MEKLLRAHEDEDRRRKELKELSVNPPVVLDCFGISTEEFMTAKPSQVLEMYKKVQLQLANELLLVRAPGC